jgi:hypothetical protein
VYNKSFHPQKKIKPYKEKREKKQGKFLWRKRRRKW